MGSGLALRRRSLHVYYKAEHADVPVVVGAPEQVHGLLGAVKEAYPVGNPVLLTVVVADDPWKSELGVGVGVGGDKGVLHYSGESTPPNGVFSRSETPTNSEPVIYYYVTADTEFPPNAEIPLSVVEAAVIEYLTSAGEQPAVGGWQTIG